MLEGIIFGQRLADWLIALAIVLGAWWVGKLFYRATAWLLSRIAGRTATKLDDILLSTLQGPAVMGITLIGGHLAFLRLHFSTSVTHMVNQGFKAAWTLCVTWLLARFCGALLRQYLLPLASRHERSETDRNMLDLAIRATSIILWGMGIIAALNNVGYDVSALIAGIGISGLALAMAAKDTVANLFGGATILADRPFNLGDRIRVDGHDGTVMWIGMRSTRIRTLHGSVVVIPNFKFTDSTVENVSESTSTHVRHDLGLLCETPPERMERALQVLTEIVEQHADDLEPTHVACFEAFKDWSLNIVFIYRVRKGRSMDAVRNRINLEILRRFAAEGLEFAYPTQLGITRAEEKA